MRNTIKRVCRLGMALGMCALLSACALLPQEEARRTAPLVKQAEAEEFKLSYVSRGNMALTKKIGCTYVPIQKVSLYFQVGGEYVDEMYVKAGDTVKAGDLLGQLRMDGVDESIRACELQISKLRLQLSQSEQNREIYKSYR